MKKYLHALLILIFSISYSIQLNAQFSFPAIAGPANVPSGSPVTLNINDLANTAGVPTLGTYSTFSVTVDWVNGSGAWSNEADLTMNTSGSSILIDPATSGSAGDGLPTTLTFDGTFSVAYDPGTDGTLDIVLNQSWSGSNADWSNIVVTIFETPSCFPPSGLTTSSITTASADLGWTAGGTEMMWNIEYGPAGFTPGTGTIVSTGTNPYALSGLSSGTVYDFYVQADCGADSSTYTGPSSFTTNASCDDTLTFCYGSGVQTLFVGEVITPGDYVTITVLAGETEVGYDNLQVYEGNGTSGTLLYDTDGDHTGTVVTSITGVITVVVDGDGSYNCQDGLGGPYTPLEIAVSCAPPPSCADPSALTSANATTTSADLGWTVGGTETMWNIEYGPAGFTPGTGTIVATGTNPYTLGGLTSNTAYDFYVQADCGADSSAYVGPESFATSCDAVSVFPFTESFEDTSSTRGCWTNIQEDGAADWTYDTGSSGGAIAAAYSGTKNARFVSQSGTNSPITKLVSPEMDLSSLSNPRVVFYYGQEQWFGDQNYIRLLYRDNPGGAWTELWSDSTDVPAWTEAMVTLPSPSATYQIAFEGINNWGRANVVDEVMVEETPPCVSPTALTVTNITTTSADLGWTAGGTESMWNIEYGPAGFTPGTGTVVSTGTNPYSLTGLTSNTAYDFYVQADCGADSSTYAGPESFSTPCEAVSLFPFTESFEDTSLTRDCWTNIQESGAADWTYDTGSSGGAISTAYSGTKNARFVSSSPSGGGTPATKLVSPELDLTSLSNPRVVFYYGQEDWAGDQNYTRLLYRDNPAGAWTELWSDSTNVPAWTEAMVTLPSPSATYQIAFEGINNWGRANVVDDVTVEETPSCLAPSDLAVDSLTTTSALLSWLENGTATTWNIEYDTTGFAPGTGMVIGGVTSNPYVLAGLDTGTTYDFYVQADCGPDSSAWAGPFTFSTLPAPACYYIIDMFDSYGDGWNGASIDVTVNCVVTNVTLDSLFAGSDTIPSSTGDIVDFAFNSGIYDFEISFDIYDPLGTLIGSYSSVPPVGLFQTDSSSSSICAPPVCSDPDSLFVSNVTTNSADLGWTELGSATTWNIEYGPAGFTPGTGTMVSTSSNPYALTGLSDNTSYDFYVQADCCRDSSAYSGPFTFSTLCNAVTSFPFTESFEDSSLTRSCWSNIQEDGSEDWTYDLGSSGGSILTAYSGTKNARFVSTGPAGAASPITKLVSPELDLTSLSNPRVVFYYGQEDWFGDQNYTRLLYRDSPTAVWVEIWSDSSNVSSWTEAIVTLPGASSTYQIAFEGINNWGRANVVDEVTVEETPSCVAPTSMSVDSITTSSAVLSWTAGGSETLWNIEYGLSGFTPGTGTTVTGVTNPYTLTGLTSATAYDYYVQADCDTSGSSTFTGPVDFFTHATCLDTMNFCYGPGIQTLFVGEASTPGDHVTITVLAGETEVGYDSLQVYEGNGTSGALLYNTDGDHTGAVVTSTTGVITVVVAADGGYDCQDGVGGPYTPLDIAVSCSTPSSIYEQGDTDFSIYPNPNRGSFWVRNNGNANDYAIDVVDMNGKKVYSKAVYMNQAQEVNINLDVETGVYMVYVTSEVGINTYRLVLR